MIPQLPATYTLKGWLHGKLYPGSDKIYIHFSDGNADLTHVGYFLIKEVEFEVPLAPVNVVQAQVRAIDAEIQALRVAAQDEVQKRVDEKSKLLSLTYEVEAE